MTDENDRKICPNCGHSNRYSAKNCTQCGFSFMFIRTEGALRKRCAFCGHYNRLGAKTCSQCGSKFRGTAEEMIPRSQVQKWCPQCGAPRREGAKVCSRCGYRYKTSPIEPPVVQSNELSEKVIPAEKLDPAPPPAVDSAPPKQRDLSGEPAPYLSDHELEHLRRMGSERRDVFVRLFNVLRDNQS